MKVQITDNIIKFGSLAVAVVDRTLNNAGVDILRLATERVPHDKGALQSSGKLERKGLMHFEVSFNTPYARRWEKTTPPHGFKKGRQSHYLESSAEEITNERKFTALLQEELGRVRV